MAAAGLNLGSCMQPVLWSADMHPANRLLHLQGMGVAASRATTCEELAAALSAALGRPGPSLIEAVL